MKVLVTDATGFIESAVCRRLLDKCDVVSSLDNINDYYNLEWKYGSLGSKGINKKEAW